MEGAFCHCLLYVAHETRVHAAKQPGLIRTHCGKPLPLVTTLLLNFRGWMVSSVCDSKDHFFSTGKSYQITKWKFMTYPIGNNVNVVVLWGNFYCINGEISVIDNGFEFYFHQRKTFDVMIWKEKVQRTHFPTILQHFCTNYYGSKTLNFPCVIELHGQLDRLRLWICQEIIYSWMCMEPAS